MHRATYVTAMDTKCELPVLCIVPLETLKLFACCVRLMMPPLHHLTVVTLPRYSQHSYHRTVQDTEGVKRNPTIRISRATRVVESNASLDREITNWKELRNLDEFLGNQVRSPSEERNSKQISRELRVFLPCFNCLLAP